MELVQVKITGTVDTARYGSLEAGDILRTDAAFAKHLVKDCGAAVYDKSGKDIKSDIKKADKNAAAKRRVKAEKLTAEITQLQAELNVLPEKEASPGLFASLLSKIGVESKGTALESIQAAIDAKQAELDKLQQ